MSSQEDLQLRLSRLHDGSSHGQFEKLRLAAECLGVPQGVAKEARTFSDIFNELSNHVAKGKGPAILYALLEVIGTSYEELEKFKAVVPLEHLHWFRSQTNFKFSRMIIRLCNSLTKDQYRAFFHIAKAKFNHPLNFDRNPTIESLLRKMMENGIISYTNVNALCVILETMGNIQTLEIVEEYRWEFGSLSQATGQGKMVVLYSNKDSRSIIAQTIG